MIRFGLALLMFVASLKADQLQEDFCKLVSQEGGTQKVIECYEKHAPEFAIKIAEQCKKVAGMDSSTYHEFMGKYCKETKEWKAKVDDCNSAKYEEAMMKDDEAVEKLVPLIQCYDSHINGE